MGVSVQVSFYPLSGDNFNDTVDAFVSVLAAHDLTYEVGTMSTVIWGELVEILEALGDAYQRTSLDTAAVMTVTVSNGCPIS